MSGQSVIAQIENLLPDKELSGRLHADLTDMLEACRWFVSKVGADESALLDREQMESLLIDIEVNMLDHFGYHLDSFRKDLPKLLEAVGEVETD